MLGIQYKSQFDTFLTRRLATAIESIDAVSAEDVFDGVNYEFTVEDIGEGKIIDTMLKDASVTTAKIANLAVDVNKLANLSVESAKLADSAVIATKIGNLAVGSAAIAALAVGTAHIANGAILAAKIGDAEITNAKIVDTLTGKNIISSVNANRVAMLNGDYFQVVVGNVETGKIYGNSGGDIIIQGTDDVYFWAGGANRAHVGTDGIYAEGFIKCGTKFRSSDNSEGDSILGVTVVTDSYSYWTGSWTDIKKKYRSFTFKDGLVTSISSESSAVVLAHVWNG